MTRDLSLGPVCNPDGSPSDVTKAMLAGTGRDPVAFAASARNGGPGSRCSHYHLTAKARRCTARVPDGLRWYCAPHGADDPCDGCRLRVRVALVVTVDVADYRLNYGTDDPDTIADDLRHAIRDAVATGAVFADGIVDADLVGGAK